MDPTSNDNGGLQLPAPESNPNPLTPMNLPLPPAPAQSAAPAAPGPQDSPAALPSVSAPIADDGGDLIEKEWVDRAKQIVARTREDPYKQSEELTVLRADYMKKHFGKTIKLK